eukprot:TRINITY_DN2454_c0_g1_i1.p1 TRINITY_DN2454_c0_g1~~TRINITY_DN2454_c0_g1_i1.p1  ORF type:complete len:634 (+),score=209.35 TRINITY_DN2454_c0_g1_i1:90-1991(+)
MCIRDRQCGPDMLPAAAPSSAPSPAGASGGGWVTVQDPGATAEAAPAAAPQASVAEWEAYYAELRKYQQQQAAYEAQQAQAAQHAQLQQQQQQQMWQQQQQAQAWGQQQQQQQQQWAQQHAQYAQQPQAMWGGQQAYSAPPQAAAPVHYSTAAGASWAPPTAQQKAVGAASNFAAIKSRGVQAATVLHQAVDPIAAPKQQQQQAQQNAYPPTLEAYVKRCFLSCKSQEEREGMELLLKQKIATLSKYDRCTRDWLAEPIPTVHLEHKAKRSRWADTPPSPAPAPYNMYTAQQQMQQQVQQMQGKLSKKQKKALKQVSEIGAVLTPLELAARAKRANRFVDNSKGLNRYAKGARPAEGEVIDMDHLEKYIVKGTMMEIEKKYFRLTSAPAPHTVRPEQVLKKALTRLKKLWAEAPEYKYTVDQLKAIRQDLTVQHIKNEFTVDVYETNARLALEQCDEQNFNQCQAVLKDLHESEQLKGANDEFLAYRILYCAIYQKNSREMTNMLKGITPARRKHPAVKHAMKVREAISSGNFHAFFRLHAEAPNMGSYLMDLHVGKFRKQALRVLCRAYRPSVPMDLLMAQLSFDPIEDEQEAQEFFTEQGVVAKPGGSVDTKATEAEFKRLDSEAVVEKHF